MAYAPQVAAMIVEVPFGAFKDLARRDLDDLRPDQPALLMLAIPDQARHQRPQAEGEQEMISVQKVQRRNRGACVHQRDAVPRESQRG